MSGKQQKSEISAIVKLQIQAGKATPAPPIGPALGQHGAPIAEFCKAYNDATRDQMGMVVPVEITIYKNRTFTFKLKTPPASRLILKALKLESGSATPNTKSVGKITKEQIDEIVDIKYKDLNANSKEAARRIIEGSCRSMGVKISA